MHTSRIKGTRRVAGVLAAAVLVMGACSEPEDDDASGDDAEQVDETTGEGDDAAETTEAPDDGDVPETTEAPDDGDDTETTEAPDEGDDDGDDVAETTEAPAEDDGSVVFQYAGQDWFMGTVPSNAVPADESLEPIKIGIINQEDTPLGSFPEVRAAAQAAANFVNAELGGVDGHPIEIIPCITSFDVEQSQSCALDLVQEGVIALVGGVDVTSNGSYPVIEQNGLAVVGGIPANLVEQRSPNAFFFSGGGAGGAAAMMSHARDNGAERVLLAYGEFDSFEVAARDYAGAVGESLGLEVEYVPFSLFATDFLPILTKAQEVEADGIIVLAADSACAPLMQLSDDLGLDAQLYLMGSCAAEAITDAAGEAAVDVIYNSEGPVEEGNVEGDIFDDVTDRYVDEPAGAAGTVGFRGMMNLYAILAAIGADNLTSESILEHARSTVDEPSFWGHAYTCDGNQVPGLPALCAPQQVLFTLPAVGEDVVAVTDWVPTDELFAAAVG